MKLVAQKTALDGGAPTVSEQLVHSGLLNPPVPPGEQARANRVIVSGEINPCEPSRGEIEKMARRRFQQPKPKRRGKWWVLRYWQDVFRDGRRIRERQRIKLALASMPEREVQKIAAECLRPMNQGLITLGSATNFTEFVDNVSRQRPDRMHSRLFRVLHLRFPSAQGDNSFGSFHFGRIAEAIPTVELPLIYVLSTQGHVGAIQAAVVICQHRNT
jgi:hypothetical protein